MNYSILVLTLAACSHVFMPAPVFCDSPTTHSREASMSTPNSSSSCNRLGQEKSPYLLQHKDNPVCWYPWGDEAFAQAKKENKPIFLSIGYSTCYWCHMMEKDSFEIKEVADFLNKHFVSIKVDREERPDVDQIYMEAVMGLTGHGGWPMSVFLTPDLKPFWGGTFFYREQFLKILGKLTEAWETQHDEVLSSAEKITEFLNADLDTSASINLGESVLRQAFLDLKKSFDPAFGGFGPAPKFPQAMQVGALLRFYRRSGEKEALSMASVTLEKMARGGLYDHLGGGFHRYSTDEKWLVPHFEKMLYDNALLTVAYLDAFQVTGKEMFREVARETLDYLLRDMHDKSGGFYSAEDAGEVKKEGEFYVWTESELKNALSNDEYELVKKVYQVTDSGNFEHGHSILNLSSQYEWVIKKDPILSSAREKLFKARAARKRPHLDDKVLTAWNGLAISAFARGYQVLGDVRYLRAAEECAQFLKSKLSLHGKLLRRYRDGSAEVHGFLDDYAYLIEGLINLYESDFDYAWLEWARDLQEAQDSAFWDSKGLGYFYSEAKEVIARKKDFIDNATPSGNSVSASNLLRLYGFFLDKKYREKALQLFSAMSVTASKYPTAFTKLLQALDYLLDGGKEIAVVRGSNEDASRAILSFMNETFLPNKVVAASPLFEGAPESLPPLLRDRPAQNGKTTIYLCEDGVCKLPTTDVEKAKKIIAAYKAIQ